MGTSEISDDKKVAKSCLHLVEKVVYLIVEDKAHVGRVQENKNKTERRKEK